MPRTPLKSEAGTSGTSRSKTGTSLRRQGSGAASFKSMACVILGTSGTSGTSFSTFRMCARDGVWGECVDLCPKPVSVRRSNLSSLTSLTSPNGIQAIENKGMVIGAFVKKVVPKTERDVPDVPSSSPTDSIDGWVDDDRHKMMRKAA